MKTPDDDDRDLVDSIVRGNAGLFHVLVEKYQKKLYNFGLKICKDSQDAEDLVQESFINVFKYLKDFRQETKFKNWMYLIASSVCYKMRRKSKFAPDRELPLEDYLPEGHTTTDSAIPEWAIEPVDQLLNQELSEQIKAAVSKLPSDYRLVLVLRDMEGFSTEETAGILKITSANVKVRLHRARLFLRDALKEYYEHTP